MKKKAKPPAPSIKPLVEGEDFYIENAFYVFTEKYLRDRGFCCQSGCRHCPYGFTNDSIFDLRFGKNVEIAEKS